MFRSPFTADITHCHNSSLTVTLLDEPSPQSVTTGVGFRESLEMDLPMSYGLGFSARLSDRWTLSLDVSRIHWSQLRLEETQRDDVLLVENGAPAGKGRAVLHGEAGDTTSVRLGAEYLWIRPSVVVPFRAGMFYDPEPGVGNPDTFFGFSVGTGIGIKQVLFDLAYEFRAGTVKSEATDTSVRQHRIFVSVINHFLKCAVGSQLSGISTNRVHSDRLSLLTDVMWPSELEFITIWVILCPPRQEGQLMLQYRDLPTHTTDVLDLTSLIVDEFAALVPPFEAAFLGYMAE